MNKTFPERLRIKVNKWILQKPQLKRVYKFYEKFVLILYHIGMYFSRNRKRYLCIFVFVLFFFTNASFAFYKNPDEIEKIQASSNIQLATEENVDVQEELKDMYFREDYSLIEREQFTVDDILEEHEEYLNESNQSRNKERNSLDQSYSFSKDDWRLLLVNKQHPIPDNYSFELATIKDGMQCDQRILKDLLTMLKDAKEENIQLAIRSPYRPTNRQNFVFNRKLNKYLQRGLSYMDAYRKTSQTVMIPGASEHEIGLAMDITGEDYYVLDTAFEETPEGKWLAENSYKYGFVLRYPKEKVLITSIDYEPWHFRYVGVEAATIMYEQKITLEELWEQYL